MAEMVGIGGPRRYHRESTRGTYVGPIFHSIASMTSIPVAASGASLDLFTLLGMVLVLVCIGGSFIFLGEKRAEQSPEHAPPPPQTAHAPASSPGASASQRLAQVETAPAPQPVAAAPEPAPAPAPEPAPAPAPEPAPAPAPKPAPAADGLDALRAHSASMAASDEDDEDVDDMATVVFRHNPALDQE